MVRHFRGYQRVVLALFLTIISGWLLRQIMREMECVAVECGAVLVQQRRDLDERLSLHEQHHVQAAMHSFHAEMSSVQIPTCSTCMETFPGVKINSRTSECLRCTRCTRDRREPKLYSFFQQHAPRCSTNRTTG